MRLVGGFLTFAALSILCAAEDIYGTCSNYSLVGTTLSATCSRQNGSTVQTSLDLVKCIGVTTDGQLECTRNGGLTLDNCGACVVFSQSQNNVSFQCKCPNEPITYYDYTTVDLTKSVEMNAGERETRTLVYPAHIVIAGQSDTDQTRRKSKNMQRHTKGTNGYGTHTATINADMKRCTLVLFEEAGTRGNWGSKARVAAEDTRGGRDETHVYWRIPPAAMTPQECRQKRGQEIRDLYIYFARNIKEHYAALELHDAVLRREGAFVAVSLFHVNTSPMVPYPNWGDIRDYGIRSAWIGPNSFPLNLTAVGMTLPTVPTQYPSLSIRKTFIDPIPSELGNSASGSDYTLEERRRIGANVERLLEGEEEAAPAPLVMFD
ncbi:hypothetical protein V8B97DRAFT_1915896 [Scleroderma yunnanense]